MIPSKRQWLAVAAIPMLAWGLATRGQTVAARPEPTQDDSTSPLAQVKQALQGGAPLTITQARNAATLLLRENSFGNDLMASVAVPDEAIAPLSAVLAKRQTAWQADHNAGIEDAALIARLNEQLALQDAPDYLRIDARDLRRARFKVWVHAPELTTGLARSTVAGAERASVATNRPLFEQSLSPFEAYVVSDVVLFGKMHNDAYLLTDAEEAAGITPAPLKPGLHFLPPNPRRDEFRKHVDRIKGKWSTLDEVIHTVSEVLEASHEQ